jgi:hypothetical protein
MRWAYQRVNPAIFNWEEKYLEIRKPSAISHAYGAGLKSI